MQYETGDSRREASLEETARGAAEAAKAEVAELREEAKQVGREAVAEVKQTAHDTAETQQHRLGETLEALAHALQAGVESLQQEGRGQLAESWHVAVEGLEDLGTRLRERSPERMWAEAEAFVRERPALAFGGAVAAGFVLARFLKSSAPAAPQRPYRAPAPYAAPPRAPDPVSGAAPYTDDPDYRHF
jgi:ElaB/YqjD/DUF883 family membrane-anchored ribosome-binding protein